MILTYFVYIHRSVKPQFTSLQPSDLHISLVKFNPFSDTGGDQSFVISLLDSQKNGILLTSLHNRDSTRIYAKKITLGKADQELSDEEKQALHQALNH